ncbi:PIN-like domain-containing protein [Macrococcus bovicus]|uniref:PIN like domain-containing protein n=1 Tax=Macrococcus bovicus TaxID=69968 RepID=A0A4R6BYM6_9STAP|nr:PIN-like domain-containing protein [Macrococcus bovicus]TDM13567.1 hypothetical protein ERX55_08205 [Macrococcus bovicus]
MSELITNEEFKRLWDKDPIVVIDSCSLLDLYRYASRPAKKILSMLEEIESQIWIPSHVLIEFENNKSNVIQVSHNKYKNVISDTKKLINMTEDKINSNFVRYGKFEYPEIHSLKTELKRKLIEACSIANQFTDKVSEEINENKKLLLQNNIETFIEHLTSKGQSGTPLSLKEKIDVYKEGEIRYKYLIPPGYKDIDKDKKDITNTKKYGDLLIWKEILKKAHDDKVSVIFITDDEKEDWWELSGGPSSKIIKARSELTSEFKEVTDNDSSEFFMLTLPYLIKNLSSLKEIDCKENYLMNLDLQPEDTVLDIFERLNWQNKLSDECSLEYELSNNGILQTYISDLLQDVEISEYLNLHFDEIYTDYDEDNIIIEGNFYSDILINEVIYEYDDFTSDVVAQITLKGNFSIEFKFSVSDDTTEIEEHDEVLTLFNFEIKDYKELSKEFDYHFERCMICNKNIGAYMTGNSDFICEICSIDYEGCPKCGKLYPSGSLEGSYCYNCMHEE